MEDLKEVARLILLQVDHNKECGKDDKFTIDEIADIIDRRVVKLFLIPPVISSVCLFCNGSGKVGNLDEYRDCVKCNGVGQTDL